MKIVALAAASLVALTGLAPAVTAPATAQRTVVHERTVVHRGPARYHTRRICRTTYRHHHRIHTCRTVRR